MEITVTDNNSDLDQKGTAISNIQTCAHVRLFPLTKCDSSSFNARKEGHFNYRPFRQSKDSKMGDGGLELRRACILLAKLLCQNWREIGEDDGLIRCGILSTFLD